MFYNNCTRWHHWLVLWTHPYLLPFQKLLNGLELKMTAFSVCKWYREKGRNYWTPKLWSEREKSLFTPLNVWWWHHWHETEGQTFFHLRFKFSFNLLTKTIKLNSKHKAYTWINLKRIFWTVWKIFQEYYEQSNFNMLYEGQLFLAIQTSLYWQCQLPQAIFDRNVISHM